MFRNKEVRDYTIKYVLMLILCGVALFFAIKSYVKHIDVIYHKEIINSGQNYDTLVETGKISYSPAQYSIQIKEHKRMLFVTAYGIFTVLGVVVYLFGLKLYKVPMDAISTIRKNSDEVLEGDYNTPDFSSYSEGDISEFYFSYTKMVTAIKQSRDKELKEKEFLQDLIADISHQLKTPLATLTIYQDLLCNPNVSDEKKQEMLNVMGGQLSRMEWLILSLLKLARLESGAIEFIMKKQQLLPTIQLAVQNISMLSEEKNQTVNVSCDEALLLNHDRDWLAEALTNILKNATEYAPKGSSIDVTVESTSVMTMIHIKDYGMGIEPEAQSKIFKRFFRAKSEVNENSIGIGLSLSKGIVEGQGGDITVSSQVGKWSCFTVSFYHLETKG
ncbi:MAG: HAMP domain-containing histidine kinase [Lachnospiraceae bacterium]|nr:HAMP domain-containing histidine kinase [Lachnospiraceae bacterium]